MNGAWEVKGEEHAISVRGVVDQLVRWFLGGTFRPRTDENDWLVLERNVCRLISTIKCKKSRHVVLSFDGARR